MTVHNVRSVVVILLCSALLAACGTARDPKPTAARSGSSHDGAAEPASIKDFAVGSFPQSPVISNRWLPMQPGTHLVYVGAATDEDERIARKVVTDVSHVTKLVDGVRTVVILDRDYDDGELVEEEITFWAQDELGNVWNLGEYPEVHEDGEVTAPDTWLAGVDGAKAGILMRAHPAAGTPVYLQGWAPTIDFADRARVVRTDAKTCVPIDCFHHVLDIEEWDPVEPGTQHKYHAANVGIIRVGFAGGNEKEELKLASISHLGGGARRRIDSEVLSLDQRAYRLRKDLYSKSVAATRR